MAKLFLYYLYVRLTERVHGVWLPSPSLAWRQAKIAYAAQHGVQPTADHADHDQSSSTAVDLGGGG